MLRIPMKGYSVIHRNIDELMAEMETATTVTYDVDLDTTDASAVKGYLQGKDLNEYCVEIYNATNEGEFIDGSDYDSAENFLKNDHESTVKNDHGVFIAYEVAVNFMDDEIRERLHSELAPCTDQTFFNAYAKAHEEKFGEVWEPAKENPTY